MGMPAIGVSVQEGTHRPLPLLVRSAELPSSRMLFYVYLDKNLAEGLRIVIAAMHCYEWNLRI
jgi:hypothetical protein